MTHAAIFAPERGAAGRPARSEAERKESCDAWLLLGLDDGSTTLESLDAAGQTVYTTVARPADAHRTRIAQLLHAALPLTFRKHYPAAIIEVVISVLELNAHETTSSAPTSAPNQSAAAASASASASASSPAVCAELTWGGDAIFPLFTMTNHSCIENCCWTASDNAMRITALRDIVRGQTPKQAAQACTQAANEAAAAAETSSTDVAPLPTSAVPVMNFSFATALVRGLSSSFERALKMQPPSSPVDVALARQQHEAYASLLRRLLPGGVVDVAESPAHPDCNFIEDTALIVNDVAVLSRPGAAERRGEELAVGDELQRLPFRRFLRIEGPDATMDGGDVLFTGRHVFVGESKRTNAGATAQLRAALESDPLLRLTVHAVPVTAGLHLKSVVSILADGVLVLAADNDAAAAVRQSIERIDGSYSFVLVPDAEASNVLRVRDTLLVQAGFPRSEAILRSAAARHGLTVVTLDMSELIKADGALTCGSLLLVTSLDESGAPSTSADPTAAAAATPAGHDATATAVDSLIPLSINYAPAYLPTSKRRAYLRSCYGFHCVCPLCEGAQSGVQDLARAFRCQHPVAANSDTATGSATAAAAPSAVVKGAAAAVSSVCSGTVSPYGEATAQDPGMWSCTRCGRAPSSASVSAFLSAESLILDDLLSLPCSSLGSGPDAPPLAPGEDALDALLADPVLADDMQPRLEQILGAVLAAAAAAGESNTAAVAAAIGMTACGSNANSSGGMSHLGGGIGGVGVVGSLSVSPSPSKTARKNARLRKAASRRAAASGTGASFFALSGPQRAAVSLLAPSHWIVHTGIEVMMGARLSRLLSLSLSPSAAAPHWSALLSLGALRVDNVRRVLRSASHWSLAREFDRMGAVATLAGRAHQQAAAAAWASAHRVHRECFGDDADATKRALQRMINPPTERHQLGFDSHAHA